MIIVLSGASVPPLRADQRISALPPKAGVLSPNTHVRFVPIIDIWSDLFDHLVGGRRDGVMARPSILAVCMLITSSNLVD
jgi:hypothetical protein